MSIPYSPDSDTTYPNISMPAVDGDVTTITYEQFVVATVAPMGDLPSNLAHMALGVCGEAGELADAIKKSFAYKKELDMKNVVEEMGDIEWYLAGMRQLLGIKRDDVIATNVSKLRKRYPTGEFTQEDAINRADKLEDGVLVDEAGTALPSSYLQVIDVTAENYLADPTNVHAELLNERFPTSTDGSASSVAPTPAPAPNQEQPATEQPQ